MQHFCAVWCAPAVKLTLWLCAFALSSVLPHGRRWMQHLELPSALRTATGACTTAAFVFLVLLISCKIPQCQYCTFATQIGYLGQVGRLPTFLSPRQSIVHHCPIVAVVFPEFIPDLLAFLVKLACSVWCPTAAYPRSVSDAPLRDVAGSGVAKERSLPFFRYSSFLYRLYSMEQAVLSQTRFTVQPGVYQCCYMEWLKMFFIEIVAERKTACF